MYIYIYIYYIYIYYIYKQNTIHTAPMPVDVAMPPYPFSRAARTCSKSRTVGLLIL